MIIDIDTKYYKGEAKLLYKYYGNNRRAIIVHYPDVSDDTVEPPIMVATVNIPEYDLPDNHVLIKNWSENTGIFESFIRSGIVEDTGIKVPTGHVEANKCKLLINLNESK